MWFRRILVLGAYTFVFAYLAQLAGLAPIIGAFAAGLLLAKTHQKDLIEDRLKPVADVFIPIFFIGTFSSIAVFLINLLVFAIGILTIRAGSKQNHLGILNYGLLIIAALIVCRFFDTDLSFVIRGLLFISVGVGFFFANYRMIRKRQEND